ncbi:MAG: ABC transporter ATP-binding protein [Chloroflexota bacterium]|nr:ABC transporter ATP-binding protein [Chloroflexota bacterium]
MAEPAIELYRCSYRYNPDIPALREVSCTIPTGTWVALIGQNGSGKTTLAKMCNGLLRPDEGRVRILGQDIAGQPVSQIAHSVGYLFQNPDHQIFAPTVREELAFGLRNLGFLSAEIERRIEEALALFGLEPYADRPPAMLGYGLRRQVTVASLFALRPPILILDEPTTGLGWGAAQALLDRLAELHQEGHTILLITHDMRLVAERAEWVLVLHEGRLLTEGPPRQIFAQPKMLSRASLSPPPITRLAQRLRSFGMRGDSLTVEEFYREYRALTLKERACS